MPVGTSQKLEQKGDPAIPLLIMHVREVYPRGVTSWIKPFLKHYPQNILISKR